MISIHYFPNLKFSSDSTIEMTNTVDIILISIQTLQNMELGELRKELIRGSAANLGRPEEDQLMNKLEEVAVGDCRDKTGACSTSQV